MNSPHCFRLGWACVMSCRGPNDTSTTERTVQMYATSPIYLITDKMEEWLSEKVALSSTVKISSCRWKMETLTNTLISIHSLRLQVYTGIAQTFVFIQNTCTRSKIFSHRWFIHLSTLVEPNSGRCGDPIRLSHKIRISE